MPQNARGMMICFFACLTRAAPGSWRWEATASWGAFRIPATESNREVGGFKISTADANHEVGGFRISAAEANREVGWLQDLGGGR
jgi:hypothetical protein